MAQFNVNLAFNADTGKAKTQIQELQSLLSKIAYSGTTSVTGNMQKDLKSASDAAKELQFHLNNAFNASTGNFDLSMLDRSLKTSGSNIQKLSMNLLNAGSTGQQAFMKLAQSISLADQPMFRISNRMKEFAVTMKNTVKWQLSSSMLHGFMGAVQSAYGYAQDLNKSLNDIRIVTGYNTDQMAKFAEQANKAAKSLSTTTTDYTNASLIYFQQGLNDAEVTERTDITVKMANAAGQSAEIISEQLTAVWNNFADGSKSLEYYADVMTALGAATASSSDEIAEGLSKFSAVAGSVGLSYEYATAALATLTSNTRESADVVGNALKTLFARIQGLQLGETLEDGTDLNKYSKALEKVGISIYDANGGLKDMDSILDEMAKKWTTLNDTQQVALAQTVAGVRQYNQLIALMENWNNGDSDSMTANLQTIKGSEGTLDKQAEIYAQSWEAAEKRVKAAAEGIFQSLLDDKFFISLNNGFANVLNGIDAFIDGAGGFKTILVGISGIIISTFANKIPQALDTFKYNLKVATKGTQEAYKAIQSQMTEATEKAFTGFTDPNTGKKVEPINRDSATGFAIEQANELTAARSKLALVSDKMSASEKQMATTQLSIIENIQQETIALKQKNEELEKSINLSLSDIKEATPDSDIGSARGQAVQAKLTQYSDSDMSIGLNSDDFARMEQSAIELSQTISTQVVDGIEKARSSAEGLAGGFEKTVNIFQNADTFAQQFDTISQKLKDLSSQPLDAGQFEEVKTQVQAFVKILPEGVSGLKDVRTQIANLDKAKTVKDLEKEFNRLKNVLKNIKVDAKNVGKALDGSADEKSIKILSSSMKQLGSNTKETADKAAFLKAQLQGFQPQHVIRLSEAFGNLTGMLTSSASILSSLISVFKTLENPNLNGWEKFSSVLMSVGFAASGAMRIIKDFGNLQIFVAQATSRAAVANANYGQMIGIINNTIQTANTGLKKMERSLNVEEKATMKAALAAKLKGEITEEAAQAQLQEILIKKGIPPENAKVIASDAMVNVTKGAQVKVTRKQVAAQMGLNVAMLPYIAIIAAIVAATGILIAHQKKQAENARANAEVAREEAAASREQTDANQKLVDSYLNTLNAYNEVQEGYANGQKTAEELVDAQNSIADSAIEVAKALGVEGAALAELSGDYGDLTNEIIKTQKAAIEDTLTTEQRAKSATGTEFIADMREGKGYNMNGQYYAEFYGGMSMNDEVFFKNVDYSQFEYLSDFGNGEFMLASGQDIESMIAAYEEVQELYNQALANMTADEMNKSELFQNIKNYLDKSKESYEAYKASEENIDKYNIQLAAYSSYGGVGSAYDISSLEEYNNYTSAMIKDLAKKQGIKEGTQDWEELTKAVYAYLGSIENVAEFVTLSNSFDDISKKTGQTEDDIEDFYNKLDSIDKSIFFQINFNRAQTEEEWKKEIAYLRSLSKLDIIQVSIELIKKGKKIVENNSDSDEDLVNWVTTELMPTDPEQFTQEWLVDFLALPEDEQQRRLTQYEQMLEKEEDLERASAIEKGKIRQEELFSLIEEGEDDYLAQLEAIRVLEEILSYHGDNVSAEDKKAFIDSANSEWEEWKLPFLEWDANMLEAGIAGLKEDMAPYETLLKEYSDLKGDLYELTVEDTYDWRKPLQSEASSIGIDYDEVKSYANYLREINGLKTEDIELTEKAALIEKKQIKAIKDLESNFNDYIKTLDTASDVSEDYANAIKAIGEDIELLTGMDLSNFTDDFITNPRTLQALEDISNGVDGAVERFQSMAAVNQMVKLGFEIDDAGLIELENKLTEIQMQDYNVPIGATLDDSAAIQGLASLLMESGATADQIQAAFNQVGWEPEIETRSYTVSEEDVSRGYISVPTGVDPLQIDQVPLDSSVSSGMTVELPYIKSATKTGISGGGYKPQGNKGGGGGGGAKKHVEKKDSSDRTRYHTLHNQLEDLESEYDAISEAADRAFGKDKLKLIDEQIEKTDEMIDKQKEYVDALAKDVPIDKAVMDAYYNDVIGGPKMEFDENGNIANYDEIEAAMHAKYNQMADKYTEDSEEWQAFEKQYEQMEKYIEDYEKYYDDLRDAEAEYQDLINQRIDLQLQKVQYKVELELDVENDEMQLLEYQLSLIEDDAFKSAEAVTLLTKQAESLYDQIQVNKQGLNDTLGLSLDAAEIASVMAGDLSVLEGKTFTEDQISAIRDYRDNLISLNEEFNEIRNSIEEQVMATFDAWQEKLERGSATLEHYGSILESYQNLVDIVGTDTLGVSSQFMADLSQAKVDNSIDQLEAAKSSYEAVSAAQKEAQEALAAAQAAGDEESISMWEEALITLNEEAQSASEELMAAWEEALSGIVEAFDMAVDRAVQDFNNAIYSLGGVEGLLDAFSNAQETSDLMLEDYQQIYELSKLSRDINNSIDDTDNLAGKQKLKKLLGEINKLQEEGVEMSQYDLEYLQAEYNLRLAEIELEEAQNAKNTVRLQKDNEGNWSYVYTQNTDAVDEAQQKYEDALYSMQDLSSNYIDEMSEQLINTSQEMAEALAAIRVEDFASIDDYYAEVERVQAQYQEEIAMQEAELQKAINNNKELYDTDWTNYHNATGYKISDTEEFVTSFKDSLLGTLLDSESDTANFADVLGQVTASLTSSLMEAAATYYQNLDSAMEAAGTTTEGFAEDTKANIEAIVEASTTGAEAIDQMATEMTEAFSAITDSVTSWQETYGVAMQEIIDSNIAVIESFNNMISALAIDEGSVTVKYDISSAPETDAAQFDTGGYTGTWGNVGKVAVLHEKELILNEDDTSNFLSAIQVTRAMLETIDLNAKQASMGVGNLVPSTVKDEMVQTLEQEVHITAEFPNVSDHNEVEEALKNLMNTASQYANRKS